MSRMRLGEIELNPTPNNGFRKNYPYKFKILDKVRALKEDRKHRQYKKGDVLIVRGTCRGWYVVATTYHKDKETLCYVQSYNLEKVI